jgi:pyridoxamine 5'-phosphate oxidase
MSDSEDSEDEAAPELRAMRVAYGLGSLDERDLEATWHEQLIRWLAEATRAGLPEPNAMVLASADAAGRPSSRTVLCKGIDARGVVFYTNYTSAKSRDLLATGFASATFPWFAMQRQAHVRGPVAKVDPAETAAYWATRPRGSQLGAWASPQSDTVSNRAALDAALADADRRFAGVEQIPPPPHWGGWRIRPQIVEFWQGRPDRMHDRLVFDRSDSDWRIRRLAP